MAGSISTSPEVPQVLIEIRAGSGLSLGKAGRNIPAGRGDGPGVNASTTWRWARIGAKTPAGEIVRLEVVKCGGRWITSSQAVDRFVMALTGTATPAKAEVKPTAKVRKSNAAAKLQALGC